MIYARPSRAPGACLALALALPVHALAAPAAEIATEADFLAPLPVVLTVSRLSQPASEAPAAVTVIDRDMIRASGFTEIADLLRLVPGFNVAFVRGFNPTLAYHGLTDAYSRRMQVLVDGRSVYVPDFGEVRWDDLQLVMEDIDRIEVVRGPDAASYGANAFLAVINIITRHPSQDAGDFVSLRGGSKDFYRAVYRHGGHTADADYRVTASTRGGSRFDNLPDRSRASFVDAQTDYRLGLSDTVQVRFGWSEGSHGGGYFGDVLEPPFDRRSEAGFVQLNWHRVQDAQSEMSLQYSHSQFRNINEWVVHGLPPLDGYAVNLNYEAARDDVEFQHTLSPAPGVRAVWAVGARADQTRSPNYFGTTDTLRGDSYRILAHAEWQASPAFLLHAGAMAERNYFTGTDVSPRLALNYFPAPGHALRIAVTKGYRTPTFYEQKTNSRLMLGSLIVSLQTLPPPSNLRPESIVSREIGYLGSLRKFGLEWDLRLFHDEFRDLIGDIAVPLPPGTTDLLGNTAALSYRNRIAANSTGAEYQLRWRPAAGTQIILSQAYVNLHSDDELVAHSAPVNSMSLLAMREFAAGISASLGYYQGGPMTWLGVGLPVDAYQRLDLKLAKRWRAAGADYEAALTLQNLLQPYSEFSPENAFDRRGFVTLNFGF
jgi:iron complex outermembrane receptor protein